MIYDVIIIGGGISGLAAAKEFYENNITNILILEAKNTFGGRISTASFGNSLVEIGAQFIHGEQNSLYEIVKSVNHLHSEKSWEAKGKFYMPNGQIIPQNIVNEILDWAFDTLESIDFTIQDANKEKEKVRYASIGTYLDTKFYETYAESDSDFTYKHALFQWAKIFQEIDNSCSNLEDLSLYRWSEFQVNSGHWQNNFRYGAEAFLKSYFHNVLTPKFFKCSSPVEKVIWANNDELVEVITANGETYSCRSLICTIPIGVLQAEMHNIFKPQLPEPIVSAIKSTGFGSITKIFLEWDRPWWIGNNGIFYGIQIVWPLPSISDTVKHFPKWTKGITGFDPVLNNLNVLLAWVGGESSKKVEQLETNEICRVIQQLLTNFLGAEIPELKNCLVYVSKWASDPFTRGSYCYRSVKSDCLPGKISDILSMPIYAQNQKPRILLAGEACHTTEYSSIQGALESGISQANKLLSI